MESKFEGANQENLMKSFLEREGMIEKGQLEKEEEDIKSKKDVYQEKKKEDKVSDEKDLKEFFEMVADDNRGEKKKQEKKWREEQKKEKDFEFSRKAAEITLARIDNFQDLWAETEQEGDKKFIEKTKKAWKEFVVHGVIGIDKETKEKTILNFTDLDGKCSLALLKLAGINIKNVEYVSPGEFKDGKINLDTGDRHGLVIEDEGKTVFMDHHGDGSGKDTSATKVVYDVLTDLELLKKEEYLNKLVDFVTQIDNKTYPDGKEHFKNSWQTIFGLQRFIQPKHLINFFKEGRDPSKKLSNEDLKKMGLSRRSKEQKDVVESSLFELKKMESKGLIIPSDYYGKIAVDVDKKVRGGFDAVKAFGCENYIIWAPEEKSFFISTTKPLADEFNLSQGKKVRDTMWIKPRQDGIPLTIKLQEILNEMTSGKLKPENKLKEFLEEEKYSWILELSEDQVEHGKIKELFENILELSKKVDIYEGLDEKSLEQVIINQTKKSFENYKNNL